MTLNVEVVAPDKIVWNSNAEEVILPSITGQLGILTGHAPMGTALDTGVMRVRPGKEWVAIALMGGFAKIEENRVTIIVNGAEKGETIDKEAARTAYTEAEARLEKSASGTKQEQYQAKEAIKRARARFQAAGGTL
ncbi:ATP synthase F1 subunit epsilon [Microcoleus sp. LAD1_D5]|uniref:ATP synthase F1 subunit epsilon n=1 Tax=unclassified Microcoleus TaxID=2642155 RepID=UPI002FD3719C